MAENKNSRLEAIQTAMVGVYGKGSMAIACAETINRNWDDWTAGKRQADHGRGLHYAVHMEIWNWFPGGGTAEIAANHVLAAVEELS